MLNFDCTRREAALSLAHLGVTGEAAEAILRETGPIRHRRRTAEAKAVALAAVSEIDTDEHANAAGAVLLIILDALGVGGHDGCQGRATGRLPPFGGLGKGRKQASDGAVWSAALISAASEIVRDLDCVCEIHLWAHADGAALGCSLRSPGANIDDADVAVPSCAHIRVADRRYLPWLRTAAREGLRLSLGLDSWFTDSDLPLRVLWDTTADDDGDGGPAAWAALLNQIEEALAGERRSAQTLADLRAELARLDGAARDVEPGRMVDAELCDGLVRIADVSVPRDRSARSVFLDPERALDVLRAEPRDAWSALAALWGARAEDLA